jgi:chitosanase
MTENIKNKILTVLDVFETGNINGDYGNVTVLKDATDENGNKFFQVTYGRHQTTEQSHLKALLSSYCFLNGRWGRELNQPRYISRIGSGTLAKKTVIGNEFRELLKKAGSDPIMQQVQDSLFNEKYYEPAFKWGIDNGFTLPLSMLVIYDSTIHSGGNWDKKDGVLMMLRNTFKEVPPIKGGDEKAWIKAYVLARHLWLKNHKMPLLRKTIYRTSALIELVNAGNWDLSQPICVRKSETDIVKIN